MDNKKIGIVTVLYNSEPVLEDFFRTLNEQTYKNFICLECSDFLLTKHVAL